MWKTFSYCLKMHHLVYPCVNVANIDLLSIYVECGMKYTNSLPKGSICPSFWYKKNIQRVRNFFEIYPIHSCIPFDSVMVVIANIYQT